MGESSVKIQNSQQYNGKKEMTPPPPAWTYTAELSESEEEEEEESDQSEDDKAEEVKCQENGVTSEENGVTDEDDGSTDESGTPTKESSPKLAPESPVPLMRAPSAKKRGIYGRQLSSQSTDASSILSESNQQPSELTNGWHIEDVTFEELTFDQSVQIGDGDIEKETPHVEDFEKVCTIGTGTFGRVTLVQQKQSLEYYALKAMPILSIIKQKQVEHVHSEKAILQQLSHPFIVKMHWAYHDARYLYMLFDYMPGGELFSYLRAAGHFSTSTGRFYSAEIVAALRSIHKQGIVYRDLKPENVLLDAKGHLKITDFGFAKKLDDRTWTLCGTPEYLAPEVIEGRGHNRGVDWWALGILIFEMLAGYPPFYGKQALDIYDKILQANPKFPKHFDLVAKDLVRKLLSKDRTQRIGNMKNGAEDVKNHKWFRSLDWNLVEQRGLKPPIIPKVVHKGDPGNFDEYDEESENGYQDAKEKDLAQFANW